MGRVAKICLVDGTLITGDKVVGNRKFTNNKISHSGTTYDIIKIQRPDLDTGSDTKMRLIVKEEA